MGVPCLISHSGLQQVVDLGLNADEKAMFEASAASVRTDIARLKPD
jgi:malate dehydrogenase